MTLYDRAVKAARLPHVDAWVDDVLVLAYADEDAAARAWDRMVSARLRARRVVGEAMVEVHDG